MTEYGFDPIFFVIPCPLPPLLSLQALKETIREKNGHSVILYVVLMYRLLNFFKIVVFLLAKYFQSVIVAV